MSSAREALTDFRRSHTIQTHVSAGHVWDVIESGSGDRCIVLLPGGGGSAESQFHLIAAFEKHMRVIAIGCPSTVANMRDALSGIRAIVDDARAERFYLLGHSLGGVFAQALAGEMPERVEGLILANTARYSPRRGAWVGRALSSAARLPRRVIAAMLSSRVKRLLHGHPDRDFWLGYFTHEELDRVGVRGIANRGECIADSVRGDVIKNYPGPTLILESGNETGFTVEERREFKAAYPQAVVQTFRGAGHLSSITRTAEFVEAVLRFTALAGAVLARE